MEERKKIQLSGEKQHLLFHPQYMNNRYGVVFTYPEKGIKVHYEIECQFKRYLDNINYLYSIDRKQVFINNEAPDGKLYEMADKMGRCLYPLLLKINGKQQIQEIRNYKQVVERCFIAVEKLRKYYTGEIALDSIRAFEHQYSNPNNLIGGIQQDLFYQLLTFPIYQSYGNDLTMESTIPVCQGNRVKSYNVTMRIDPYYTPTDKIIVKIRSDRMSLEDSKKHALDITYKLYADTHSIFSVIGHMELPGKRDRPSVVSFEIFHLNYENRLKKGHSSLVYEPATDRGRMIEDLIIEETSGKPAKKWYQRLFD